MSARGTPDEIRARAEERFKKAEVKAVESTEARAEHDASIAARDANTKRLKGLRLAKEQDDRDAAKSDLPEAAS
jgi:hypothetical protein